MLSWLELENHFIKTEKWEGLLAAKSDIFCVPTDIVDPISIKAKKYQYALVLIISNSMDIS